jgi:hypothetical protein
MQDPGKDKLRAMAQAGKLLTQQDVLKIWPISREFLSRITNHPNESKRLPSYRYGKKPLYAPEELLWWRDKQRYEPRRRGSR